MHTKIFFLFFLVLFGAYAEFQAGKTVKRLKSRERRPGQQDTIPTRLDSATVRQPIDIFLMGKMQPNDAREAWEIVSEGNANLCCLSAEEITSFGHHLKAGSTFQVLSKTQHVRNECQVAAPEQSARDFEYRSDLSLA